MKQPSIAVSIAFFAAACACPEPPRPICPSAPACPPCYVVPPHAATAPPPAPVAPSPPLDPQAVAAATGGKPEVAGTVVKVSFPRADVPVEVDGQRLDPFLGLTSWAAFEPGKAGVAAMVMGDLVLFEDEVNPVMSALFDHGLDVTALHNHFFFARPAVYFMHIGGEGTVAALGAGVKAALDTVAAIRKKASAPAEKSGAVARPSKSAIDAAAVSAALGVKTGGKDGMVKAVWGRQAEAACGCAIGKAMGVNTWAAFSGDMQNAAVDGDFAVTEAELQPVLRALRAGGIDIVAIHSHMTGESPRILFLHFWGRGKALDLAAVVSKAVAQTGAR